MKVVIYLLILLGNNDTYTRLSYYETKEQCEQTRALLTPTAPVGGWHSQFRCIEWEALGLK